MVETPFISFTFLTVACQSSDGFEVKMSGLSSIAARRPTFDLLIYNSQNPSGASARKQFFSPGGRLFGLRY